mmetsp:Transcript_12110/g.24804  ORF Transcript_12110/g.24804 Transcript_12110/m.24804 type:complete len:90 (+) Transcript_12110:611-880(+)
MPLMALNRAKFSKAPLQTDESESTPTRSVAPNAAEYNNSDPDPQHGSSTLILELLYDLANARFAMRNPISGSMAMLILLFLLIPTLHRF